MDPETLRKHGGANIIKKESLADVFSKKYWHLSYDTESTFDSMHS